MQEFLKSSPLCWHIPKYLLNLHIHGKDEAKKVKKDIEKKKSALLALQSLNGKTPASMTKAERDAYDIAVGQLLNILDTAGKVAVS